MQPPLKFDQPLFDWSPLHSKDFSPLFRTLISPLHLVVCIYAVILDNVSDQLTMQLAIIEIFTGIHCRSTMLSRETPRVDDSF